MRRSPIITFTFIISGIANTFILIISIATLEILTSMARRVYGKGGNDDFRKKCVVCDCSTIRRAPRNISDILPPTLFDGCVPALISVQAQTCSGDTSMEPGRSDRNGPHCQVGTNALKRGMCNGTSGFVVDRAGLGVVVPHALRAWKGGSSEGSASMPPRVSYDFPEAVRMVSGLVHPLIMEGTFPDGVTMRIIGEGETSNQRVSPSVSVRSRSASPAHSSPETWACSERAPTPAGSV